MAPVLLTWPLVFDKEELQPLLEGVLIDIELHLHPVEKQTLPSQQVLDTGNGTPESHLLLQLVYAGVAYILSLVG